MKTNDLEKLTVQYDSADIFPVVNRYPADLITPLGAYLALSKNEEYSFLLESVEGGESLARYSFLGADPEIVFGGTDGKSAFEELKLSLDRGVMADLDDLPSFAGGAVGYFEFSDVEHFEPVLRRPGTKLARKTTARFMLFTRMVAFDHAKQELMVISLVFKKDTNSEAMLRDLIEQAEQLNRRTAERLTPDSRLQTEAPPSEAAGRISSNWIKDDFLAAVDKIKELIWSGDVYQVVLSQCFSKKTAAGPVPIYRALRSLNPSPYMFIIRNGDKSLVGASPEMLLRCRGDRLEYRPIAGTRPRHRDHQEDARLAQEMHADEKEVAEHTMLVDLGRNDLGRVAKYGSVAIRDLMNVEKFSHVQHLVTYLTARLGPRKDRFDAFASCFPAGTVTGAPKIRAIQTIYSLEPTARGVYAGAIGYFDFAGNLDTCIAIRTLVLENGVARVQAGAGIVADSVPEAEYEETVHKAAGLFRAVELAESGGYGI